MERFDYCEAGPQLLLQAFLQRIVNGGGRIEREYGLGRGRTDLLIVWSRQGAGGPDDPVDRIVIECKVLHRSLERTIAEGLVQTTAHMDRCRATEGYLVVFDRSAGKAWEEKDLSPQGKRRRTDDRRVGDVVGSRPATGSRSGSDSVVLDERHVQSDDALKRNLMAVVGELIVQRGTADELLARAIAAQVGGTPHRNRGRPGDRGRSACPAPRSAPKLSPPRHPPR